MKRSLRLLDVAIFVLILGTNLQWVATAGAAGVSSLVIWVVGAIALFVPLTVGTAFLSAIYPEEGGIYVWTRETFGPFWGFLCGWLYWSNNLPYLAGLLYFTVGNALFAFSGNPGTHASPLLFVGASLAGLALGTIVNIFGLGAGKWLNLVVAVCRWGATILLIGVGIATVVRFGSATAFTAHAFVPTFRITDMIFWTTIGFAYAGIESIAMMSGEIQEPRRSIPLGLFLAAPFILLLYIAGTVSVLVATPAQSVDSLYGVTQSIANTAARFGMPALGILAGTLVTISCFGSVAAWLCSSARLPFVAGLDSYLPQAFGKVHPKYGSPVVALVVQGVIAAAIVLLGQGGTNVKGAYDVLVSMGVITTFIPYIFLFGAVLVTKMPMPAGLAVPGGRATVLLSGAVGLFTTIATIVLSTLPAPDEANKPLAVVKIVGLAVLLVLIGIALYANGVRTRRRALSTAEV